MAGCYSNSTRSILLGPLSGCWYLMMNFVFALSSYVLPSNARNLYRKVCLPVLSECCPNPPETPCRTKPKTLVSCLVDQVP